MLKICKIWFLANVCPLWLKVFTITKCTAFLVQLLLRFKFVYNEPSFKLLPERRQNIWFWTNLFGRGLVNITLNLPMWTIEETSSRTGAMDPFEHSYCADDLWKWSLNVRDFQWQKKLILSGRKNIIAPVNSQIDSYASFIYSSTMRQVHLQIKLL